VPRRRIARAQSLVVMMLLWFVTIASADPIDDRIVDLTAATSTNSPRITLSWTHRLSSSTLGYSVFRRLKGPKLWNKLAELSSSSTNYPDATALTGINYEYKAGRRLTESSSVPPIAYGYVCSGVNVPATEFRGKLVLLVDQTMATPLSAEISELIQDLTGDGWQVLRHNVPRMAVAPATTGTNVGPARDGIPNLMKFGLDLSALESGYQVRLNQNLLTAGGGNFLALTYTRPEPAPAGMSYTVETCDNLINWSANETIPVSTNHHGNGTVSIVVRDTIGTPPASKRFIRLKVLPAP
jgi:hypothetical protein